MSVAARTGWWLVVFVAAACGADRGPSVSVRDGDAVVFRAATGAGPASAATPLIEAIAVRGLPAAIARPLHLAASVHGSQFQTYRWSVSCAGEPTTSASFTAPNALETDMTLFSCASEATVTFSLTNPGSRGNGSLTATAQLTLSYVPQGLGVASITLNSWPQVSSIGTASNAEPRAGEVLLLAASASDPDGDRLVYAWSDDCGGAFDTADALSTGWTAPARPGASCELTLVVREAGNAAGHNDGWNSGSFRLQVAPTITP